MRALQCRQEQDDVRSTAIDACQSSTTASRAFTSIIFLVFFFVIIKKLKLFPISKMVGFCNMSPFFFHLKIYKGSPVRSLSNLNVTRFCESDRILQCYKRTGSQGSELRRPTYSTPCVHG